jgi:hypothetical protein
MPETAAPIQTNTPAQSGSETGFILLTTFLTLATIGVFAALISNKISKNKKKGTTTKNPYMPTGTTPLTTATQNPMTVAMTPDIAKSVSNSDGTGVAAKVNKDVVAHGAIYNIDNDSWSTDAGQTINLKAGNSAGNVYEVYPVLDGSKAPFTYINKITRSSGQAIYIIVLEADLYPDLTAKPHFCFLTRE